MAFKHMAQAVGIMSNVLVRRKLTQRQLLEIQQLVNAAKEAVDDLVTAVAS